MSHILSHELLIDLALFTEDSKTSFGLIIDFHQPSIISQNALKVTISSHIILAQQGLYALHFVY